MLRSRPSAAEIAVYHKDIPAYSGTVIIPRQADSSTGDALRKWVFGTMPEATDYVVTPVDLRQAKRYLGWSAVHGLKLNDDRVLGCYTGTGLENWRQIEESMGVPIEERSFNVSNEDE